MIVFLALTCVFALTCVKDEVLGAVWVYICDVLHTCFCASTMLPFATLPLHYSLKSHMAMPFAENYFDYTESFVFTRLFNDMLYYI